MRSFLDAVYTYPWTTFFVWMLLMGLIANVRDIARR